MKRKDYLVEELTNEEKLYLKRIVMTAKNKYIKKNYQYINSVVTLNEDVVKAEDSIIDDVIENCVKEVKSAEEFERTLYNPILYKYVKALTLKEKEVLFYVFWQKKQVKDIAEIMGIHRTTVKRIKNRALSKIAENMLDGGGKNV